MDPCGSSSFIQNHVSAKLSTTGIRVAPASEMSSTSNLWQLMSSCGRGPEFLQNSWHPSPKLVVPVAIVECNFGAQARSKGLVTTNIPRAVQTISVQAPHVVSLGLLWIQYGQDLLGFFQWTWRATKFPSSFCLLLAAVGNGRSRAFADLNWNYVLPVTTFSAVLLKMAFFSNTTTAGGVGATGNTSSSPDKDIEVVDPPTDSISSISFSSQADYMAVGSWDNSVRSW